MTEHASWGAGTGGYTVLWCSACHRYKANRQVKKWSADEYECVDCGHRPVELKDPRVEGLNAELAVSEKLSKIVAALGDGGKHREPYRPFFEGPPDPAPGPGSHLPLDVVRTLSLAEDLLRVGRELAKCAKSMLDKRDSIGPDLGLVMTSLEVAYKRWVALAAAKEEK